MSPNGCWRFRTGWGHHPLGFRLLRLRAEGVRLPRPRPAAYAREQFREGLNVSKADLSRATWSSSAPTRSTPPTWESTLGTTGSSTPRRTTGRSDRQPRRAVLHEHYLGAKRLLVEGRYTRTTPAFYAWFLPGPRLLGEEDSPSAYVHKYGHEDHREWERSSPPGEYCHGTAWKECPPSTTATEAGWELTGAGRGVGHPLRKRDILEGSTGCRRGPALRRRTRPFDHQEEREKGAVPRQPASVARPHARALA